MPIDTRKVNGTKGGYLQPIEFGRDSSGDYQILEWQGTTDATVANINTFPAGATWSYKYSYSGAKDTLTVRVPYSAQGEAPLDVWEFYDNMHEKDIMESDIAAVESLSTDEKDALRAYIANPSKDNRPAATVGSSYEELIELVKSGVRSVTVSVPTLKHTRMVSGSYAVAVSLTNVRRIISSSAIATLESIPSPTILTIPNFTSTRSGLVYGWFKRMPTVRQAARAKTQIEQEWNYGLWSTLIYGALVTS